MLLYHQESLLSMLWNAAQDYSGIKRMQRRNEQEKGEEKETTIRDCIEAHSAAWLNIIFSIIYGAKAPQLAHKNPEPFGVSAGLALDSTKPIFLMRLLSLLSLLRFLYTIIISTPIS